MRHTSLAYMRKKCALRRISQGELRKTVARTCITHEYENISGNKTKIEFGRHVPNVVTN